MGDLRHIAIIMDGNGRWAKKLNYSRLIGHEEGAKNLLNILTHAVDIGLSFLTLFVFSCENWQRPKSEIDNILSLFEIFVSENLTNLSKKNIRVRIIGRRDNLPAKISSVIEKLESYTQNNTGLSLNLAFNYSGRDEIVRAAEKYCKDVKANKLDNKLTIEQFSTYFDTAFCIDPDLVIRTGGEMRLSNFLLWQIAYSELYFCNCYWPDFTLDHLKEAIENYMLRERRYGKVID